MEQVAIIDFETTGLSPNQGARATEIGVVILSSGKIVDRFQSLMNSGAYVSAEITALTGISNQMLKNAPSADKVMREVSRFVGNTPLIAHNASFDEKFWNAELLEANIRQKNVFACSMLVARRIFPTSPSHKLADLVRFAKLPQVGNFHRAMADAEMTAHLVLKIEETICKTYATKVVTHQLLRNIQTTSKANVHRLLEEQD